MCSIINLTHLCFADDLILFTDATEHTLQGIKNVFQDFYSRSGLKVSPSKIELFYCCVFIEQQKQLSEVIGFDLGVQLVRYFGLLLITRKLRREDCKPLVDKMISRVNSWSSRFLSFADVTSFCYLRG